LVLLDAIGPGQLRSSLGRNMRVAAENRHEIWASVGLAVLGITFSAPMPMGFGNVLVLVGCLLVALFCAFNAILDLDGMSIPGKFFGVIWFGVILVASIWVLIWAFGIHDFANK
jgi:hypothetical protein